MSVEYHPNNIRTAEWEDIPEVTREKIRITGKTAYDLLYDEKDISELDQVRAYIKSEDIQRVPDYSFRDDSEVQKLNFKSVEERPSANPYSIDGREIYIVDADTWISDLRMGNERFFRKKFEENPEFRKNVLNSASDDLGKEIDHLMNED